MHSDLLAISDLRRITGQPSHIIDYAVDRHGPEPAGRIGITRVWLREDLPRIQESLRRTAQHSTLSERRETAGA
ncbi:MAG: hypothetical protein ACYTG0_37650 [Planctomycetota bacterium]|jgi:hypothetical protein